MTAWAEVSDSDDSGSDDENVQIGWTGEDKDAGIIDATTPSKGNCDTRLWISADELAW